MDNNYFHDKIRKTIEACSYPFYVVKPNHDIACTCTCHSTKEPDPKCKKCLGTGYKITIKIIKGASDEEVKGGASLNVKSTRILKNYYILAKYPMKEDDYIVDDGVVYYVYRNTMCRGLLGEKTHQELIAAKVTNNQTDIINNFNEIINKRRRKK